MVASSQPKTNIGTTPYSMNTSVRAASFVSRSNSFFNITNFLLRYAQGPPLPVRDEVLAVEK